jgi:hypothetical protein
VPLLVHCPARPQLLDLIKATSDGGAAGINVMDELQVRRTIAPAKLQEAPLSYQEFHRCFSLQTELPSNSSRQAFNYCCTDSMLHCRADL